MADSANKGATDAPKNATETRDRAEQSGIFTHSDTGATGARPEREAGATDGKLGTGDLKTEATAGTSAAPKGK